MDPLIGGALIAGASDFFGGLLSNDTNRKLAKDNRDFMRDMSNTEVTRRVADLKNAGLNPMLGYNSAASTPNTSPATVENVGSSVGRSINSGLAALRAREEVKNLRETNRLIQWQADNTKSDEQLKNQQKEGVTLDNQLKELELGIRSGLMPQEISSRAAQFANSSVSYSRAVNELHGSAIGNRISEIEEQIKRGDLQLNEGMRRMDRLINESDMPEWRKAALRRIFNVGSKGD